MNDKKPNWFKRHKILTVIFALFVIGVIGSGASKTAPNSANNNQTQTSTNQGDKTATAAVQKADAAKIGTPVRDGKFEFTVKSVECGRSSVGANEYLRKDAQGQYCLLSVTVKNIGDRSQSLFSANQKLFNDKGQQYAADDTATMYASPQGSSWYDNINPGNSVEGTIVFDLPKDQTPASAELHDSAMSSGVKVSLQ